VCCGTESQCNIPNFYKLLRTFAALRHRGEEKLWKSLLPVHYTTPYFTFYTLKANLLIPFGLIIAYNNNNNNNNNIYLTAIGSSPGGSGFCDVYKKT
jgi:hypothetical protein